jgi:hypothetical protein
MGESFEDDSQIVHVGTGAVGAIIKSEVEAQLDAAHRYPRSIKRFLDDALTLATHSQEIAESCLFALPRDGKMITGPSVRLAEICASAYGNLHYGGRVVDDDDKFVTAQGGAWDLQKNTRVTIETRRRITNRAGKRYNDDMVAMTGNAASSIAMRNAIFRVIPRALVDQVYAKVRKVAVGDAQTLIARRDEVIARLLKRGVPTDRVLARLDKKGIEDIGLEELEMLIGLGTAIKNGDTSIDEAFPVASVPPPGVEVEGRRVSLKGKKEAPPEPGSDG